MIPTFPLMTVTKSKANLSKPMWRSIPTCLPTACRRKSSADLPDGQINGFAVQPRLQKYSASRFTQIKSISIVSHPTEGRIAIVTDAGWDAMDAEARLTKRAEADGKAVWS
jgi:hypothetical protein